MRGGIVEIQFDLSELVAALGDQAFAVRAVNRFMVQAGSEVQATWVTLAQRLQVRETGQYIAGIESNEAVTILEPAHREGKVVTGVVEITATAPHSHLIEVGHAAFHLPSKIDWGGPSIKVTKTGKKLLHIPFRHSAYQSPASMAAGTGKGTTTSTRRRMMPAEIYAKAKEMSRTTRHKLGPAHKDGKIVGYGYSWGSRMRGVARTGFISSQEGLSENMRGGRFAGRVGKQKLHNPGWQTSKFEGMFKGGDAGQSRYMTIRTITPDSPGWNIPAKEGLYLAKRVSQFMPNVLGPMFAASVIGNLEPS